MAKRAAFITIGQAPREDILGEMAPWWGNRLAVEEHGVLDGLTRSAIDALAPANGAPRLVSRLIDGTEVVLDAARVHERLASLVGQLDAQDYDFLVLLCTGPFDGLTSSKLLVKAQPIVDHGARAIASPTSRVGVLVPHAQQMPADSHLTSYASPYDGDRFVRAAGELESSELIVMHCMGYTAAQKKTVASVSGRPVLLAREMVASAVSWLLG